MPIQSKTQVGPQGSRDETALARRILNLLGRNVDAAFRTLSLDTLLVRGRANIGNLVVPGTLNAGPKGLQYGGSIAEYRQLTSQTVGQNTFQIINFDTKVYDPLNEVVTGQFWNYTLNRPGLYLIQGVVSFNNVANSVVLFSLFDHYTANEAMRTNQIGTGALVTNVFPFSFLFAAVPQPWYTGGPSLAVGRTVDIRLFQSGPGSISTITTAAGVGTSISVAWLGPVN